ncbi:MAG: Fic family protein [Balneolaceae bacterium]|jgi:Fic family protein
MRQDPLYRVNPDRNVPWNGLPMLPIDEQLYKDVETYEQLGKAKEALALLAGRSVAIPNQALLINSITLQEAKDSSAIENVFTTEDDLYQAFSDAKFDDTVSASTKEVLRYREAVWKGYEYLREKGQFDINYFISLYQEIKETKDGIRPPFAQTYIRQGGSGPNAGKRIYTPPKGKDILEDKLANLVEFLNDKSLPPSEPLLKMAIAHFQFEAIHPFRDGNGRAGRILNIHYITHSGLLELPILYLSRYIIEHKQEYYDTLAGVSQRGDWKSWLLYMLRAVESTARLTYQKVNDLLEAKSAVLKAVESERTFQRPDQLIDAIFTQPFTKVSHLTDAGMYAENTARNYLNELSDMGVLEKKQIKGRHYYQNRELEHILAY